MWKKLSKHFVLFIICLLVIVFIILPYSFGRLFGRLTLDRYLKNEYYLMSKEMYVKHIGNNAHANIKGIHGDRHRWWIDAYEIKAPFMDKKFEVWVDKRNYQIYGTDFYEVLSTDPKFQHLYSEWIKKKVGIEDENVELEFKGAMKKSAWVGDKPYIDFDKITSLENLEEQICENTHNLYLYSIDLKNVKNDNNWLELSKRLKEEYINIINSRKLDLIFDDKVVVKLYYYEVDLAFDRYNKTTMDKNKINFYYVQFDLKNDTIKYMNDYCDNTFAIVLETWLKDIKNED